MNATLSEPQDGDDTFETCLSPSSLCLSDNDVDNSAIVLRPYFEPLRLSDKKSFPECDGVHNCNNFPISRKSTEHNSGGLCSCSDSENSGISAPAMNLSYCIMADSLHSSQSESLLNRTCGSLHLSGDSPGQCAPSTDLTTVTALSDDELTTVTRLSDLGSLCALHSVRIRRQPVLDGDGDRFSLVETVLVPTNRTDAETSLDANTSCQRSNMECSYLSDDGSLLSDWKTASEGDDSDGDRVEVSVPDSVKSLSAAELRAQLAKFGECPGPIVDSTRHLHELRLSRLMAGCHGHQTTVGVHTGQSLFKLLHLLLCINSVSYSSITQNGSKTKNKKGNTQIVLRAVFAFIFIALQ